MIFYDSESNDDHKEDFYMEDLINWKHNKLKQNRISKNLAEENDVEFCEERGPSGSIKKALSHNQKWVEV